MFINDSDFLIVLQIDLIILIKAFPLLSCGLGEGIGKGRWGLTSPSCSVGFSPRKK